MLILDPTPSIVHATPRLCPSAQSRLYDAIFERAKTFIPLRDSGSPTIKHLRDRLRAATYARTSRGTWNISLAIDGEPGVFILKTS